MLGDIRVLLDGAAGIGQKRPVRIDGRPVLIGLEQIVHTDGHQAAVPDFHFAIKVGQTLCLPPVLWAEASPAEHQDLDRISAMRRILLLLALASAFGQSVEGPVFEAAWLKKIAEDHIFSGLTGGPGTSSPTRASMHWGAQVLLQEAFGLPSYAFVNTNKVPDDKYDFAAVVPMGATKAEFRAMLRNLLIERFHLRYHRETREIPVYELRVAPGGHKLKPAANEPPDTSAPSFTRTPDGYLTFPRGVNTKFWWNGPKVSLQRVHTTMDEFAAALDDDCLHNPVLNLTGLTGQYDFYLRFDGRRETPANDEVLDPPLDQSLRDQLGLVLRQTKGPHEVIVIDSFDREATPN
jgi:uncharacterized protein (TIGR03435 family)